VSGDPQDLSRPGLYRQLGSYSESAYAVLKHAIITLELPPGSRLGIRELRARTALGAGPLREALARLAGERLVNAASQRGFTVAPISRAELAQLAKLRAMLEAATVADAVSRGEAGWLARIEIALAAFTGEAQGVGETRPLTEHWDYSHRSFHMTLMSGCGEPVMLDLAEAVYDRFDRYRRLGIPQRGYLAGVKDDHAELVQCAIAGDAETARAVVVRHVMDVSAILDGNIAWEKRP